MKKPNTMKKIWTRMMVVSLVLVLALGGAFFGYTAVYYHAEERAVAACYTDDAVAVEYSGDDVVFRPQGEIYGGLVFYPGGKVEHTAYAPLMRALAQDGVLCVLLSMPFRLAVFGVNRADGIREKFEEVPQWFIGGHSLGGSMACNYVKNHARQYDGVLLCAAYSTADLFATDLTVLSVYGTEDGVMNRTRYEQAKSNLPKKSAECVIEGGNHAGFGAYGAQKKDGTATVSSEVQIALTVDAFRGALLYGMI